MEPTSAPRARIKVYSHLAAARRMPTSYEIGTSRLRYASSDAHRVRTPVDEWLGRHQRGSRLTSDAWEEIRDPRDTTYASYVARRSKKEAFIDEVLASIEALARDEALGPAALQLWSEAVAPMRFLWHGFQMCAAYLGQLAPAGRLTVLFAFQMADEVHRIQRIAYRLAQIRRAHVGFVADGRACWQEHPAWQPMRRLLEDLLVTWDWGEAFVALNLCVKPMLDDLAMRELAGAMSNRGDFLLRELLLSLADDCAWQREWSAAVVTSLLRDRQSNRDAIEGWLGEWSPRCVEAVDALAALISEAPAALGARVAERHRAELGHLSLRVGHQ
ncbi:MAG: hypothetical protein ACHREM_08505 [Polyangiales bacterium]